MSAVINLWTRMINKIESDVTIELDEIIFSKKHGHEICVMHLIGKNSFPKMTTEEILSTPQAMTGLSKEDLITITRLDMQIKQRKATLSIVEIDSNGTVVLENNLREKKRYSQKLISSDPSMLDQLKSRDAFGMGYRVGFKEGLNVTQQKKMLVKKLLCFFKFKRS